ncbi:MULTISPECIES: hypothetical protein [Methanocalculus]|nr:hypothetical protein [Methanocalculus sp. MSAO_Arc1]
MSSHPPAPEGVASCLLMSEDACNIIAPVQQIITPDVDWDR